MVTLLRKIKILMSQILDFYLRQGCASYFFSGPVAKLAFMKIEILKKTWKCKETKMYQVKSTQLVSIPIAIF